jgi:uncharacterized protein with ParB-like and HNH nuclease domain
MIFMGQPMPDETIQSIKIDHETIGHILTDRKILRVPENQRSYAWKKEHVRQLFRDFAPLPNEYFLGSIVVVGNDSAIEVHDGQQRLATSMLLIAAIRDAFLKLGDEVSAKKTEEDFLWVQNRRSHEVLPRFTLNAEDNDYFIKRVLTRPSEPARKGLKKSAAIKDSNERIREAAVEASEWVETVIISDSRAPADNLDRLHSWLDFIERSARVIWVQVADEKTAFTIFETMNDRGLKLSIADLLKNCIYSRAEDRKKEALQKWQSMTAILESIEDEEEGVVEYLRYSWIADNGFIRSKDLYDKMKSTINSKTKALDMAVDLEIRATEYSALLNASHEQWAKYGPDMKNHIRDLRILGVRQIRPILLAAMRKFNDKQLLRLFNASVNWSVRCLLGGVPSGTIESYYAESAKSITDGKTTDVDGVLKDVAGIMPTDDRFEAAVASANVAQPHLSRYYLRALQIKADGNNQYGPFDSASVTIEHVLPKVPSAGWSLTSDEAKGIVNRLGNQALLEATANHGIGNAPFKEKKAVLLDCKFSLTNEIGKLDKWSLDEINKRQQRLATLAVQTWPLKP